MFGMSIAARRSTTTSWKKYSCTSRSFRKFNLGSVAPAFGDRGVDKLARLRNLHWLELSGEQFTDRSLSALKQVSSLRGLVSAQCGITFDGVKQLGESPNLECLLLSQVPITESDLRLFRGFAKRRDTRHGHHGSDERVHNRPVQWDFG